MPTPQLTPDQQQKACLEAEGLKHEALAHLQTAMNCLLRQPISVTVDRCRKCAEREQKHSTLQEWTPSQVANVMKHEGLSSYALHGISGTVLAHMSKDDISKLLSPKEEYHCPLNQWQKVSIMECLRIWKTKGVPHHYLLPIPLPSQQSQRSDY